MEFDIDRVSFNATHYDVRRALAQVLHSEEFYNANDPRARPMNIEVILNQSNAGRSHDGTGKLTLPTRHDGEKFFKWLRAGNSIKVDDRKLFLRKAINRPKHFVAHKLQRVPFVDPDIEEEREQKLARLDYNLRVTRVQFGIWYTPPGQASRAFSVEWDHDCKVNDVAWLYFKYDHKLIRIELGDPVSAETKRTICVKFVSINKIGVGNDCGNPFICFELHTPALIESEDYHRALTGDEFQDGRKFRHRLTAVDEGHARVAPYAHHLRLVLVKHDDIRIFANLCTTAGLPLPALVSVDAAKLNFGSAQNLRRIEQWVRARDWPVAFQIEALLHNCLVNTADLLSELYGPINRLYDKDRGICAEILRSFVEALRNPARTRGESALACFSRMCEEKKGKGPLETPPGNFSCRHVSFTPTRLILEGPYAIQSNRVIRRYVGHQDHFIRVDFRDEDRLQYRWDREMDGSSFLQDRVGRTLKEGFELGGRRWEFLAYSSSALGEHSVWFMNPFHSEVHGWVDSAAIRMTLGDFSGVLRQPAKYAARMAQAFTATDPAVKITRDQWEEVDDLGNKPYLHTDGVGTISSELAERIWTKLCEDRPGLLGRVPPSCYQIRFLGYKGMVAIDTQLQGIKMRLRPSMNKFKPLAEQTQEAEIEIAQPFSRPMKCNLNKALIMILEDRGVPKDVFMDLQNAAKADVYLSEGSIKKFRKVVKDQTLGGAFRLSWLAEKLQFFELDLSEADLERRIQHTFFHRLVRFTIHHTLREIKHGARIPVDKGWLLPGVADEGPAYQSEGRDNVYHLPEGFIFLCVQDSPEDPPEYVKGSVVIWRSPTVHPGDVQRVNAIGKPPSDKLCLFGDLKNCVVFPSVGDRSLPSMLGGGDLDGDIFCISREARLLPMERSEPADYTAAKPKELDRPTEIDDICDFIVEYIQSDVLGMLSVDHLVIADQSKEGVFDKACMKLAELCSLAVDYPKSGRAVDPRNAPRRLIPFNPDWRAAEVVNPQRSDYYESSRAVGHLYRDISLPPIVEKTTPEMESSAHDTCTDNVSTLALQQVQRFIPNATPMKEEPEWLVKLFQKYLIELRYISATHTVSHLASARLTEEEIVVGTILAECSQNKWRRDRTHGMRIHVAVLARDTEHSILKNVKIASKDELLAGLERAWCAWCFSVRYRPRFGVNSFGLIALGVIFTALEQLEVQV